MDFHNELGSYIRSIRYYERITVEEEKELSNIIQNSTDKEKVEEAKEKLITSNLFLVVSCANKRFKTFHASLTLSDLVSAGNKGLIDSVRRYEGNHESNAVFSTYAVTSINRALDKAIKADHLIYIPSHQHKYKWAIRDLKTKYGEDVSDEIIMKELDLSPSTLERIKTGINSSSVAYLENLISEDRDGSWEDFIENKNIEQPSDVVATENLSDYLKSKLKFLNEKQRMVIEEFHFNGGCPTYREVSKKLGSSPERIRQIHHRGLKILKGQIIKDWNKNTDDKIGNKKIGDRRLGYLLYNDPDEYNKYYKELFERERKEAKRIITHFIKKP